jgi:Na+/H+ antiporter NhaC
MHPTVPEVSPKCRPDVNNQGFFHLWREEVVAVFRSLWKHRLAVILLAVSLSPFALIVLVAIDLVPYARDGALAALVLLSIFYAILWGAGINAWQRQKNPRW